MFNKLPKYPTEYFQYGNEYTLSNEEVETLIRKALDTLLSNSELHYTSISTGDTKVMVERGDLEGDFVIEVYKNYHSEFISFR